MATGSDHGFGGPAARRLEARYTAASLVTSGVLVSVLALWVVLGWTTDDGARAVAVEGPWYAVVGAVPAAACLLAVWLAQRGRLSWIVAPALVVAAAPAVVAAGSLAFDGPGAGHTDIVRGAGLHLLALPLLVGAAVTGRDVVLGVLATALAVMGYLGASGAVDDGAWSALVWLPFVALVVLGTAALARRHVGAGWAVVLALALGPAVLVVATGAAAQGPPAADVLRGVAWFLPAIAVLLVAVWRETTDPLIGLAALPPAELLEPSRRALRRAAVAAPTSAPHVEPVPSGEAHR